FAVREIEAADAGEQKFAPHRRHRVVEIDVNAGGADHLRRHQTRRATTDNGDCCHQPTAFRWRLISAQSSEYASPGAVLAAKVPIGARCVPICSRALA